MMGEPSAEKDIKAAGLEPGTEINFYNKGDNEANRWWWGVGCWTWGYEGVLRDPLTPQNYTQNLADGYIFENRIYHFL